MALLDYFLEKIKEKVSAFLPLSTFIMAKLILLLL